MAFSFFDKDLRNYIFSIYFGTCLTTSGQVIRTCRGLRQIKITLSGLRNTMPCSELMLFFFLDIAMWKKGKEKSFFAMLLPQQSIPDRVLHISEPLTETPINQL